MKEKDGHIEKEKEEQRERERERKRKRKRDKGTVKFRKILWMKSEFIKFIKCFSKVVQETKKTNINTWKIY